MAIFGKKKPDERTLPVADEAVTAPSAAERPPEPEPPPLAMPLPAAPAPVAEPQGSRLIVGPNIRLTGSEITDCDTVIVEGRVEATVDGRVMQISETGVFSGTVAIDMAEIRGNFQGELTVRKRLTVCGTGKVAGHIRYGTLVVEEGGELSGDVDALGAGQTAPGRRTGPGEGKGGPAAAPPEKTTPAAGSPPPAG
jgi:cytoskeletal protein CcmA (bactofilin family)